MQSNQKIMSNNVDADIFERATQLAKTSTMTQKHSAIIVYQGKIVAEGVNHIEEYMAHCYSIHAEVDALFKLKHKGRKFLEDCTMICVRVGSKNLEYPIKLSRPCPNCEKAIKQSGLKKIFYSA